MRVVIITVSDSVSRAAHRIGLGQPGRALPCNRVGSGFERDRF